LPFDDAILHKAPFEGPYGILTACKGVLHDVGQGHIYNHYKGSEDPKNFLMALSRLDPEHKERCFHEIVSTLEKGDEGLRHIRDHLMEGVWNKIIEYTASNNNALLTIEATRHREKFKKEVENSTTRLLPSLYLPHTLRLMFASDEKMAILIMIITLLMKNKTNDNG